MPTDKIDDVDQVEVGATHRVFLRNSIWSTGPVTVTLPFVLQPGQSARVSVGLSGVGCNPSGIIVTADPRNDIAEISEANNVGFGWLCVPG